MPEFLEKKLKQEYGAKSPIPYKIMNKLGVMRGNRITQKGVQMEHKHQKTHQMHIPGGSMHEVITIDDSKGTTVHTIDSAQTYCVREALGNPQECAIEPDFQGIIKYEE